MRWIWGGSLPALYSLGDRITSRLNLDLFWYMVIIYKEYDMYHIWTDHSLSSRFLPKTVWCMSISVLHHTPSSYGLDHPWCCGPCPLPWVSGLYPPQLVPERLVSAEQHRLEQVRVVWHEADQFNQWSEGWKLKPTSLTGELSGENQSRPV